MRLPGGIASSLRSQTWLIWSSFRLATAHKSLGQVLRAARVSDPSNMSSVPRFRNDLIIYHIIRDSEIGVNKFETEKGTRFNLWALPFLGARA